MSRPRTTPETIKKAFVHEIKMRRTDLDMTQSELGDAIGVVPSVMSKLLANPDKISAERLREIIQTISPDPVIVLTFLGYTAKDIQKLRGSAQ